MTGPVLESAEVFSVQRVGEYVHLTVIAPQLATGARPGHFVSAAVGGEASALVTRRALFVAGATPGDAHAGTIQLVVSARGDGTRWIANRRGGERLDLIGPLGTPFPLPAVPTRAVLVGDGWGSVPLVPLAQALRDGGSAVEVVLGAPTAALLYGERPATRFAGRVTVVTADGSAGATGPVTALLPDAIARLDAEVVYACGPGPMLRDVAAVAQQHAIRAQVAVAMPMECGTGVCLSCVLPIRRADGSRPVMARACVEGPVFEAARVRWPDVVEVVGR